MIKTPSLLSRHKIIVLIDYYFNNSDAHATHHFLFIVSIVCKQWINAIFKNEERDYHMDFFCRV